MRFGRLVARRPTARRSYAGQVVWECDCDCGTRGHPVAGNQLTRGAVTSCGKCARKFGKCATYLKRFRSGRTRKEIAAEFEVKVSTVDCGLRLARKWERDEINRRKAEGDRVRDAGLRGR